MMNNNLHFETDVVILADGSFPTHEIPLSLLHSAPHVVCCDGAIRHWPQAEAVVGDGDSVPEEYHDRMVQVDEQEDNDLTKATRYCLSRYGKNVRIAYLGATGMREDHTIGNIALLVRYLRDYNIQGRMFTDYGWFVPFHGSATLESFPRQQVSIFNFGCTLLRSEGLRWNSYPYEQWWQGTLNEAVGKQFSFEADGDFMVYRTYIGK